MREITLDETRFETVAEMHDFLAKSLDFPADYAADLDALYECLVALSEPTYIILKPSIDMDVRDGRFNKFCHTIERAAKKSEYLSTMMLRAGF